MCGPISTEVWGPFVEESKTINSKIYLKIRENYVFPKPEWRANISSARSLSHLSATCGNHWATSFEIHGWINIHTDFLASLFTGLNTWHFFLWNIKWAKCAPQKWRPYKKMKLRMSDLQLQLPKMRWSTHGNDWTPGWLYAELQKELIIKTAIYKS